MTGPYTHTFAPSVEPTPLTITVTVRRPWWLRPFLWLLRRPTSRVFVTYENCLIDSIRIDSA